MTDKKQNQSGRSMIEMMGYMMVAMSVIVAIGSLVSSAFDNHKYSVASLQLTELVGGIVKSSAIDVDYTGVINKINNGEREFIPNTFRVTGSGNKSKIYHAFGGEVAVGTCADANNSFCKKSASDNTNNADMFFVIYKGLSKKQCTELALKDWSKNQYADLYALIIGSKVWYWQAYGTDELKSSGVYQFPVLRSQLTGTSDSDKGACDVSNNSSRQVIWVFN